MLGLAAHLRDSEHRRCCQHGRLSDFTTPASQALHSLEIACKRFDLHQQVLNRTVDSAAEQITEKNILI
jgi:hypothetical protein